VGTARNRPIKRFTLSAYRRNSAQYRALAQAEHLIQNEVPKARALGETSTSDVWTFDAEQFAQKHFSVDASYDGAINSIRIMVFGEAH
jgi:hypothetical protein